jgi:hypothetical protein
VRFDVRRTLIGLVVAGAIGAAIFPFALYSLGLALAPPRPVPAPTPALPLIADALWARAGGGRAVELVPLTPISFFRLMSCGVSAHVVSDGRTQLDREADCQHQYLPAFDGVDLLSAAYVQAEHPKSSDFRNGISQYSTNIWLTHSFTKAQFLATFAERGDFALGFRGVEAAAHGYFGRSAADLTLPEVAMIAGLAGTRRTDPWCNPAAAAARRHMVLVRMRDNAVIDEQAFHDADVSELGVMPPPATHQPCTD